ncbi:MAG: hypothetical protein M3468_16900 [Acidobacteriota bacterium]|nr:hypothetical protein [Acidobacteriota bacterium]
MTVPDYRAARRALMRQDPVLGEARKPYRSVASWYLWRSLENEPVKATPSPTLRRARQVAAPVDNRKEKASR